MRKQLYLLLIISCLSFPLFAQVTQVAWGPGYGQQVFYALQTDSSTAYDHSIWDIAFTVSSRGASVYLNEAVGTSRTAPPPEVELYLSTGTDFASADTTGMTRLYNPELSWDDGAFNSMKDATDPFDFGWGSYNSVSNTVDASRFFIIKLRGGTYHKLEIQSLISGVFTFRFADLDGSNEQTKTVTKADYTGKSLVYYSFEQDSVLDLEPAVWDLKFDRYYTLLDDGNGGMLNYMVTGIISAAGVEVAQADGVDTMSVSYMDYDTSYSSILTSIGHDWKTFDLDNFAWSLPSDRAYFLKNSQNELWKILFIDFEGSSTGIATFKKTFETEITSLGEKFESLLSYEVYPNPAADFANIAFELDRPARSGKLSVSNQLGQIVLNREIAIQQGLNVKTLPLTFPSGMYYVSLEVEGDLISKKLIVR